MANNLPSNPLVIDTAAAAAVISSYIRITKIKWFDSGADIAEGDQAIINNSAGNRIWEHRAGVVGTVGGFVPPVSDDFNPPINQRGVVVPTLTHGTLFIYWTGQQPTA